MKDDDSGPTPAGTLYLRQNGWCHCVRSFNTATGTFEDGVSVYECAHVSGANWRGVGPAFEKRERLCQEQQRRHLGGVDVTWYLVSGERAGTGGDGEPLLHAVVAYKIVEWDGENYFRVVSDAEEEAWSDHDGYPDCRCQTIDDLLAQT